MEVISLDKVINFVLAKESLFEIPVLNNVVSFENKILVKIEKLSVLKKLAENAKSSNIQCLKTGQLKIEAISLNGAHDVDCKELTCVVKLFLNGVSKTDSWGKFLSVATSIDYKTNKASHERMPTAIVSVFVKNLNENWHTHYTKSYRQHSVEKETFVGLQKFISNKDLENYVSDKDSLTIAISILFC